MKGIRGRQAIKITLRQFLHLALLALIVAVISTRITPLSVDRYANISRFFLFFFGALAVFLCGDFLSALLFGRPQPKPFSLRRFGRRCGLFLIAALTAVTFKLIWFEKMRVEDPKRLGPVLSADLLERRQYLLRRVADPDFGPHTIPVVFQSPMREELAIATLSMTTLAVTNIAFLAPETQPEAKAAVGTMIAAMLTPAMRRYEILWWGEDALDSLAGEQGHIGYLGHLNLMLACHALLGGDDRYEDLFARVSEALARRALRSPGYNAETFPGLTFVADNAVVIASLALRERAASSPRFEVVNLWLQHLKDDLLDEKLGLVRYHVGPRGEAIGTPRGVLQAWNSLWLPFIDPAFAAEQYRRMKLYLKDELPVVGLAGVREYPKGVDGPTDFIAWPLVMGVSGSATAFAIGGARWAGDSEFLNQLLATAEVVGSTVRWKGERFYLAAPLLGEAIVLAARTMGDYDRRYICKDRQVC